MNSTFQITNLGLCDDCSMLAERKGEERLDGQYELAKVSCRLYTMAYVPSFLRVV